MDKRVKYTFNQKLLAVRSITSGQESNLTAARKIGCNKAIIQRWVRLYKQHGVKGLSLKNGSYKESFKLYVVRYMLKNKLSILQTAAIFAIPQHSAVSRWLKAYKCYGQAGLIETRGRKKSLMAKKIKKKKGTIADPSAEKVAALQKELEYLRAENAFLKKLDALIQQEEAAKAQSKQQKSSRN